MNTLSYLRRIDFRQDEAVKPNLDTLIALQKRHLYKIPFENLDIQLSIPIVLEVDFLYHKIVEKNRGGYCYELNALFCALLQQLGFDAYLISGKIIKGKNIGPEYDHLAIIVKTAAQLWLADVGYGDFSLTPLLIQDGNKQYDGRAAYSVKKYDDDYWAVGKLKSYDEHFHTEYIFSLKTRTLQEFQPIHLYKQQAVDSHFTKTLICSRITHDGRISIINNKLIHTCGKERVETHYENLNEILKRHFQIALPDGNLYDLKYLHHQQFA